MSDCEHREIQTWFFEDNTPAGVWSCMTCKHKFVPITELMAAEAERDSLRAELDRLTTLRPASEHDGKTEVIWWDINQGWKPVRSAPVPWTIDDRTRVTHWTPIPTPKEVK